MKFPGNYSECIEESGNFVVGVVTQVIVHGSSMGRTLRAHINSSLMIWISETVLFDKTQNILSLQLNTYLTSSKLSSKLENDKMCEIIW